MWDVLYALGRGLIKFLIALFIGVGVGLVTIGSLAIKSPEVWNFRQPPPFGPLLLGIGAGLLTAGAVMFILIFIPWPRRSAPLVGSARREDGGPGEEPLPGSTFARAESFRRETPGGA
ncbi:MAG: hypothetical protein FJ271_02135 [Planctomycetes bacterium]|nr:hypothetical protein [Planctomycetota bacterium]